MPLLEILAGQGVTGRVRMLAVVVLLVAVGSGFLVAGGGELDAYQRSGSEKVETAQKTASDTLDLSTVEEARQMIVGTWLEDVASEVGSHRKGAKKWVFTDGGTVRKYRDGELYAEQDYEIVQRYDGDPLKDMDIRPTCAGIEGGRFGEEARVDAQGNPKPHWGLDLGGRDAEIGTEVNAVEGGSVIRIANGEGADEDGWGNFVIVDAGGTFYLYAHLSRVTTERGAIDGGDKIGESGNADEAECNPVHLHLEVREGERWPRNDVTKRKDPEKYVGAEFSSKGRPVSDKC